MATIFVPTDADNATDTNTDTDANSDTVLVWHWIDQSLPAVTKESSLPTSVPSPWGLLSLIACAERCAVVSAAAAADATLYVRAVGDPPAARQTAKWRLFGSDCDRLARPIGGAADLKTGPGKAV